MKIIKEVILSGVALAVCYLIFWIVYILAVAVSG